MVFPYKNEFWITVIWDRSWTVEHSCKVMYNWDFVNFSIAFHASLNFVIKNNILNYIWQINAADTWHFPPPLFAPLFASEQFVLAIVLMPLFSQELMMHDNKLRRRVLWYLKLLKILTALRSCKKCSANFLYFYHTFQEIRKQVCVFQPLFICCLIFTFDAHIAWKMLHFPCNIGIKIEWLNLFSTSWWIMLACISVSQG